MNIYLDDDIAEALLATLLRKAGHDVQVPADVGLAGERDPIHLTHAIRDGRVLISQNHDDFNRLHNLLMAGRGHHPGILVVRKDNNPKRDMQVPHIVRALRKLISASVPIADEITVLNTYR